MSNLYQIVIAHHQQAGHIARKTLRQRGIPSLGLEGIKELKRVGRKFTTRVERRLRKLETDF